MHADAEKVLTAFPDYDVATLPIIPPPLVCDAWPKDSCPVWRITLPAADKGDPALVELWADYPNEADRMVPGDKRFAVFGWFNAWDAGPGSGGRLFCKTDDGDAAVRAAILAAFHIAGFECAGLDHALLACAFRSGIPGMEIARAFIAGMEEASVRQ
ncbi:hypothetical protein KTR66_09845 [Roseococcus sp. SDR]|uniref:hypothetical protein n=1 Tax=Roseococcus sp. SDR TaxID=2835532 RepID=UPI001BCD5B30|nr:hypothetical protein [Roseococcus sp. SDR]MBS7790299.1 hypothetical protein [Roseococcus sp. SDR]MBV1845613.1 hypothetical protein [Roseococcus sp. SDR]